LCVPSQNGKPLYNEAGDLTKLGRNCRSFRCNQRLCVIKTFISGVVLGVAGFITALHFLPVVNISREVSIISVSPNGGNSETFHVNIPTDRILLAAEGQKNTVPPDLEWPAVALFEGTRSEIFKVRNSKDAVVGVASRLAVQNDELGGITEWVLHMPARGSMYVTLDQQVVDNRRVGNLRSGTREFDGLQGSLAERWIAEKTNADAIHDGRIELVASYMSRIKTGTDTSQDLGGER
jgi:hypothetical protein